MAYYILQSYKLKHRPFEIFQALSNRRNCFFLDASLNNSFSGRYSFLGVEPFSILEAKNKLPFKELRNTLEKYKFSPSKCVIPFLGGAVGYLTYDLGFNLENKIKKIPKSDLGIPDAVFGFYSTVVIIDHWEKELYICATGFPEKSAHLAKSLAEKNFKKMYKLLSSLSTDDRKLEYPRKSAPKELKSNFSKEDYILAIKKAKEYIRQGDIYQVNLSQRFSTKTNLSPLAIYARLRSINASCFSAYQDFGSFQILSSSPERFLKLEKDLVITSPMKGTRPRAKDRIKDKKLREELLASAKDKAELVMIVDLERNDLGKVCDYNSVKVEALRQLEKYNTVFQTTATVSGRLYKNKDRVDLLEACFPGGSITGCPKIRAMEIIEELEPDRRSIYTGCLGYLSFSGEMDFNILIRTILKKENEIYFGSGGGIVTDSDPEDEYQETLVKARGMIEAIS